MIYFDNASTTFITDDVYREMDSCFAQNMFNPSSPYSSAHHITEMVLDARERIANTLNCHSNEIYFTGSGSEADNWAIKGVVDAYQRFGIPHIITTKIEHHAVLNTCRQLEELKRAKVTYIDVGNDGIVNPEDVAKAITKNTVLVSVMSVNNEIGTIQPLAEIGLICKNKGILFHTDAVQAYGKEIFDTQIMDVDLLSASAHKIHGPKGIGFLYIRDGTKILPLINGGQQEYGMRAGTENVPYIIGFAKAAELEYSHKHFANNIRGYMYSALASAFPKLKFNGNQIHVAPNIMNVCFAPYGVRAEELVAFYDQFGICVSSGSACNSHSGKPSHVLKAIGMGDDEANSSIRISFNDQNTLEEVNEFIEVTKNAVSILGGKEL